MAFYLSTHTVRVALLGDSITSQMAPRQGSFPAPFNSATNLGIGGQTTAQIAARVGSIPSSATHVVIQAGTNDLFGLASNAGIIPGYTSMLNAIPSSKRIIIIGVLPVDEVAIRPDWLPYLNNAAIKVENLGIADLCRAYPNCVMATGIMAKPMKGKTADGVHPTAQADVEIVTALLPLLGL